MAVSPLGAAKRLCKKSGWSISNLELQKILYIAHMYFLGQTGSPLITGHFEAWDYGPVQPSLYHRAKVFGSSPVKNIFHIAEDLGESAEAAMIDDAASQLSGAAPGKLVAITHWDQGAWAKHYVPGRRDAIIPNEDILQEYLDRGNARRQEQG